MYIIVGLGNPGEEYARTRHNTGRMAADFVAGVDARRPQGTPGVRVFTPETFMNKTGPAVAKAMAGKTAKKLIVIYDDLDLPLGTMKISFNRSSGGHKGLESIIKSLKTKEFIRIRIGIGPTSPRLRGASKKGKIDVEKYILSEFKKPEMETLKKVFKKVALAVEKMNESGLGPAMTEFN